MDWKMTEARRRFSSLVDQAIDDGPQTVTRRGKPVAVVMSMAEYRRLASGRHSFKDFLRSGPNFDALARELDR